MAKKEFIVTVKEVWNQCIKVEADSAEEALDAVREGDGVILNDQFEYAITLDSDTWDVYEIKEGEV